MQHFADEPDDTRPRNPWPRLLAFAAVVLVAFIGLGACFVAFLGTGAKPELRVALTQFEPGLPDFEPVTRWGADPNGFTYGAWIIHSPDEGTIALFNRNVGTHCTVEWVPADRASDNVGVFRDRCDGSTFDVDGRPIDGNAPRHLDFFALEITTDEVVVDVKTLYIGQCGDEVPIDVICGPDGTITRTIPLTGSIPVEFARN